ncbi:RDD family protein [Streptomyces sp. NPDC048577]|uniref:RDD family protein n=1 Tax=Streptomyces sp. NPDC048577 TaxID=3157209 RepID=UPI0034380E27
MATPPGGGGEVPQAGYYPDPSIPGYIRYWNGAAWVPGTSRPAPGDGEAPPAAPASSMPAGPTPAPGRAPAPTPFPAPAPVPAPAVDETGPVFFDEEPLAGTRSAPEPASAWQADASRQTGFGGDRDQRVSWGSPEADPRTPAAHPGPLGAPTPEEAAQDHGPRVPAQDPRAAVPPEARAATPEARPEPAPAARRPASSPARLGGMPVSPAPAADPTGGALPGVRQPAHPRPPGDGALKGRPAGASPSPVSPAPQTSQAQASPAPVATGPGGGAPSWPQQVHQLAQPGAQAPAAGSDQPAPPWKPPVEDPFLQAARAQAAARPAGLGRRLAARLVDTLVFGAIAGGAAFPFVTRAVDHIDAKIEAAKQTGTTVQVWLLDGTTSVDLGIALALFLVLGVVYEALPTARWGRTLGKKLCGLEVRDIEAHEPPTFGAALRRWLVYGVLGLLVLGVLNVLWCLFDRPWRQCWHDKAARTFVAG